MKRFETVAIQAVRRAGASILKHYGRLRSSDIHSKGNQGPVTTVDLEANRIIINTIRRAFPAHDFLSEETGFENNPDQHAWIIDPLDGTTNYIMGSPFFCTAVALVYKQEILLSIIYAPLLKELFIARQGKGTYLNGRKARVSATTKLAEAIITIGRSHQKASHNASEKIQKKLERLAQSVQLLGSDSLDLTYAACGRVDGCLLVPPRINAWDSVPGVLLVREAGGVVTDFRGKEWRIGSSGVVAANKVISKKLTALVR